MAKSMKAENKEALKGFFGEFAIQIIFSLIVCGLGGVSVAYVFIGWGVLWLLVPFGFAMYLLITKFFNSDIDKNKL